MRLIYQFEGLEFWRERRVVFDMRGRATVATESSGSNLKPKNIIHDKLYSAHNLVKELLHHATRRRYSHTEVPAFGRTMSEKDFLANQRFHPIAIEALRKLAEHDSHTALIMAERILEGVSAHKNILSGESLDAINSFEAQVNAILNRTREDIEEDVLNITNTHNELHEIMEQHIDAQLLIDLYDAYKLGGRFVNDIKLNNCIIPTKGTNVTERAINELRLKGITSVPKDYIGFPALEAIQPDFVQQIGRDNYGKPVLTIGNKGGLSVAVSYMQRIIANDDTPETTLNSITQSVVQEGRKAMEEGRIAMPISPEDMQKAEQLIEEAITSYSELNNSTSAKDTVGFQIAVGIRLMQEKSFPVFKQKCQGIYMYAALIMQTGKPHNECVSMLKMMLGSEMGEALIPKAIIDAVYNGGKLNLEEKYLHLSYPILSFILLGKDLPINYFDNLYSTDGSGEEILNVEKGRLLVALLQNPETNRLFDFNNPKIGLGVNIPKANSLPSEIRGSMEIVSLTNEFNKLCQQKGTPNALFELKERYRAGEIKGLAYRLLIKAFISNQKLETSNRTPIFKVGSEFIVPLSVATELDLSGQQDIRVRVISEKGTTCAFKTIGRSGACDGPAYNYDFGEQLGFNLFQGGGPRGGIPKQKANRPDASPSSTTSRPNNSPPTETITEIAAESKDKIEMIHLGEINDAENNNPVLKNVREFLAKYPDLSQELKVVGTLLKDIPWTTVASVAKAFHGVCESKPADIDLASMSKFYMIIKKRLMQLKQSGIITNFSICNINNKGGALSIENEMELLQKGELKINVHIGKKEVELFAEPGKGFGITGLGEINRTIYSFTIDGVPINFLSREDLIDFILVCGTVEDFHNDPTYFLDGTPKIKSKRLGEVIQLSGTKTTSEGLEIAIGRLIHLKNIYMQQGTNVSSYIRSFLNGVDDYIIRLKNAIKLFQGTEVNANMDIKKYPKININILNKIHGQYSGQTEDLFDHQTLETGKAMQEIINELKNINAINPINEKRFSDLLDYVMEEKILVERMINNPRNDAGLLVGAMTLLAEHIEPCIDKLKEIESKGFINYKELKVA